MIDFSGKTDTQIVKMVMKDHNWLVNDRKPWEALWEVETRIFQPRRFDLMRINAPKGKQYGAKVYDGHPANAANKFALGMLAHQMNRSVPWIAHVTSDIWLMKDDNVKKYVQGAAEQIQFGLNDSDIYGQSVWFAKDWAVIGTGVNIPQENKAAGKMHYETVHPRDSYQKFDHFDNLITYHRPVKMSAIEIVKEFGDASTDPGAIGTAKLPAAIKRDATGEKGNPFNEYDLLYAVYRNPAPNPRSLNPQDKKFRVFYILRTGAQRLKNTLLFNGGTQFEPIVSPYGREPQTNYGVSIAADALTEGLQANKLGELLLTMVHREANPPTEAPQALKELGIKTNPGGRNYIPEKYVGRTAIRELFTSGNWPISDAQAARLHATIDDKFFVPLWDALLTLEGPQRTLGEVLQIQGNKSVLLSPVSESFEDNYLRRIVDNQWIFEEQIARRMPDVPDILLEPANRKIQTVFIGPLPQLQRATMQTRGAINALAIIKEITTEWPNSRVKIKEMELIEEAAISQGMKQSLIRSDEEVREILEADAAAQAADRRAELMIDAAGTVPGLAKAPEPGSPLEQLQEVA